MSGIPTELPDFIPGVDEVVGAISYMQDPWGNTFKALKDSAKGLANDLLPAFTEATLPDFSADWFIRAYQISFATSIFLAVVLIILQIVRTARGTMSGRELAESFALYFPGFIIGGMFGPAAGITLVNFFHSLSNVFIRWGVIGTADETIDNFQKMLDSSDPVGMAGGVVIAVILMLLMIFGLIMVLIVLLVQLIALYFTGALFTLGYVWILSPTTRKFALKMGTLFLGILASHPLLFLLLGLTFRMMGAQTDAFGNNASLKSMVQLIVAFISLMMAALSPLILMKFAPVLPMGGGGGNGPSVSTSNIGSPSISDAIKRHGSKGKGDDDGDSSSSSSTTTDSTSTSTSTETADVGPTLGGATPTGGGGPATGGATTGARAGGVSAAPAAGVVGEGAAAGGGAVAAEAGVAAAGIAESGTGVGAVVGIPTILAAVGAVGVTAAAAGAVKAAQLTEEAGALATEAMDEPPIGPEGLA